MNLLRNAVLASAVLATALTAQNPCFDTNLGTDINAADDTLNPGHALGFTFNFAGVGYTDIVIDPNGCIYFGATTTAFSDFSPSEAEFLASASPRIAALWTDLNAAATGSGNIYFNAIPASGPNPAYALITWNGVYQFGTTNPVDLQIRIDANSAVEITYGANSISPTNFSIIGATPGAGALSNPVSFATLPLIVASDNFAEVRAAGTPTPSNLKLGWTPTVPGYVIVNQACTPNTLPPVAHYEILGVGCPAPAGLNAGDDSTHAITLPFAFPTPTGSVTDIVVSSNGFLTLGTTNPGSGCCNGDAAVMVAGQPRFAAYWSDLNAGGSGTGEVYAQSIGGEFVVTWDAVAEYVNVGVNSFQIALSPSGNVSFRYGTIGVNTHTFLTGYSIGLGAVNPGSSDLSAAIGVTADTQYELFTTTNTPDLSNSSLLLIPTGTGYTLIPGGGGTYSFTQPVSQLVQTPQVGSQPALGSSFNIDVTGISVAPQGNAVLLIVGFTELNPGVDLGIIGAPGCNAYLLPSPTDFQFLNLAFGAPSTTFSLAIPNTIGLAGIVAVSEAASDDATVNAFGWKFSNGVRWTLGL